AQGLLVGGSDLAGTEVLQDAERLGDDVTAGGDLMLLLEPRDLEQGRVLELIEDLLEIGGALLRVPVVGAAGVGRLAGGRERRGARLLLRPRERRRLLVTLVG